MSRPSMTTLLLPGQLPLHFQQDRPAPPGWADTAEAYREISGSRICIRHIRPVQYHVLQAVRSVMHADVQFRQQRGNGLTASSGVHALADKARRPTRAVDGAGIHI